MHTPCIYYRNNNFSNKIERFVQDAKTVRQLNEIVGRSLQVQKLVHVHNHGHHLQKKKRLFPDI